MKVRNIRAVSTVFSAFLFLTYSGTAAAAEFEQKGPAVNAGAPAAPIELEQKGPPVKIAAAEQVIARVKLKDGKEISGLITGYENNSLTIIVNELPAKIPLGEIESMTFRNPPPAPKGFKVGDQIEISGFKGYSGLRTGDWDGDGKPELYTVNEGKLRVFSLKGALLAEKEVGPAGINFLSDIDKDKKDEVFISWAEGPKRDEGAAPPPDGTDEDSADPAQESSDLIIAALDHDLKELKRFRLPGGIYNGRPDSGASAAALLDLNNDGKRELLAIANSGYGWKPRAVYCLDWETGKLLWQYNIGPSAGTPIAADINGDGKLEVIFGSYSPGNGNRAADGTDDMHCYIFALSHKGEKLWTKQLGAHFTGASPLLEDVDGDGKKEIFARIEAGPDFRREVGQLVRLDKDGEELARFDAGSTLYSCEAADLAGNMDKELVCTDRQGSVYLLDKDLKVLVKRSLGTTEFESIIPRIAGARDLDGDGKAEAFLTYSEQKFVSGRNPRSDGGPRNIRHYYNNSVLVLDGSLGVKARYIAAGEWKEHPGFSVLAADVDGDKKPELLSLSDKAMVLKLAK